MVDIIDFSESEPKVMLYRGEDDEEGISIPLDFFSKVAVDLDTLSELDGEMKEAVQIMICEWFVGIMYDAGYELDPED